MNERCIPDRKRYIREKERYVPEGKRHTPMKERYIPEKEWEKGLKEREKDGFRLHITRKQSNEELAGRGEGM